MKLFNKNRTSFPQKTEYAVEEYFTVKGEPFYQFVDASNIPAGRSLAALKYYIPLMSNCDDKYLNGYVKAMETVLDANPIKIESIFKLKNEMKDRLTWAFHPQHLMKYASVVYLSKNENPYTYDEVFNEKKIEFWKENATAHDFFLSEPIVKLMPLLKNVGNSFPEYSQVVMESDLLLHKNLLDILSLNPNSAEDVLNINSAITALKRLRDYVVNPSTNISSSSTSSIQLSKN